MPEYNVYLGIDCVIDPQVSYSGHASDLKSDWQVGTYSNGSKGALKEVSTDPTFNYKFQSGGTYFVHLTVTDGTVGKVMEYKVNVNRTFEQGYLLTATDADGKPYRLLRLPMPDALYDDGDRLPATYANFLIINGAVIVPTYAQEENDARALALVAEAFPGYDIIGIDSRTIVRQHGSIHCLTMQYPAECQLAK